MSTCDSRSCEKVNDPAEYLNKFKQMKLPDGETREPIAVKLKKIRIFKYKQFEALEEGGYVLDLDRPLTTLVGPNSSGKTTLLEIVRVFCNVVKDGSKCYSVENAKERLEIQQEPKDWFHNDFCVRLQGIFDVYYGNQDENIKSLRINMSLKTDYIGEDKYSDEQKESESTDEDVGRGGSSDVDLESIESTNEDVEGTPHIHVRVTAQCEDMDSVQWEIIEKEKMCPTMSTHGLINHDDYGILKNLLPQIISFNSKSVSNDLLENLNAHYPDINKQYEEIKKEIERIFPFIQLNIVPKLTENNENQDQINDNCKTENSYKLLVLMSDYSDPKYISGKVFLDVSLCGEGVLKCLYIILTICCAKPNSIITIDEPDAHVFPDAQKLLINFFYRKMEQLHKLNIFCQMIITTHSTDIMQTVKLEDIQQIFVHRERKRPIVIRSLFGTRQLFDAMTSFGTSILSHGELVRFGVHRKLVYLESHHDYDFLHGLIHRGNPELLNSMFTRIARGGRTTPAEIRKLIILFRQFLPEKSTFHIFILVDADLQPKIILEQEKKDYDDINNDLSLNVKLYYHCWAAREWENWLLSNENLLYEMLCDDEIYRKNPAIKDLRDQVKQHYPTESIFNKPYSYQHNQSVTTTDTITSKSPQYSKDKQLFEDWFKEKLEYHFGQLLTKLAKLTRKGIENISGKEEKELQREAADKFLTDNGIDADTLGKFGHLHLRIIEYIGYQLRKESEEYKEKEDERKRHQKADANARKINEVNKKQQNNSSKTDEENPFGSTWLSDRGLPPTAEDPNAIVRKELSKWIDAKLFFHQLTHGKDSKTKIIDLDDYWKKSFAMEKSEENLYKRYFNSLNPQNPHEWPGDFKTLLKTFQNFVEAP